MLQREILVFTFTIFVLVAVTAIVSSIVRHSPSVAKRKAIQPGVLFIVCFRRWASIMLRVVGIAAIVLGALLLAVSITTAHNDSSLGMGVGGVILAIGGALFAWLAYGVARSHLEITADTVWIYPMLGKLKKVNTSDITKLRPLLSSNYGGIVAYSNVKRLFYASRVMLGYPQLIEYFRETHPDLEIPPESLPL